MRTIFMLGVAASTILSLPVAAQETTQTEGGGQLGNIIVTAERRESILQKTGLSVSVRAGDDLVEQGRVSLPQILEDVPSVSTYLGQSPSQRASQDMAGMNVAIRGVAANVVPSASILQSPPAAAVYVDGVYEGIGGSYDLRQVEILRGPQGTLYGRSATAGAVNLRTRDPQLGVTTGDLNVEAGNYGLINASGGVNIPLGEQLAMRISGRAYEQGAIIPMPGVVTAGQCVQSC